MVGVVTLPEKVLNSIKKNIPSQWKACVFAALIAGLFAHLYKITNWTPNWDSLVFRYDYQDMTELGRWFLHIVCAISSFYDLPFLNGILSIIFHAIGAVCICRMFRVKTSIAAGLIGAVVVSFPTVTSVMMYNYVADGYGISFLLSCMAAMFMTEEKPKYALSAVLIMLSVAIYQAYIAVTIMLILIYLITELLYEHKTALCVVKKASKLLLTGTVGMLIYYAVLMVILSVSEKSLLEYQGIGSAFALSDINMWDSLYIVKNSFLYFFFDFSQGINVFGIINCILFVSMAVFYVEETIRNKIFSSLSKTLLLAVFVVLLPMGAVILAFINPYIDYHTLMKMGYCMFYVIFILLYEKNSMSKNRYGVFKVWTVFVLSIVLIMNQILIANISYHKGQLAYEKSYATLIRIADRIEQTDNAEECDRIMIAGQLPESEAYSAKLPLEITGITEGYILRHDDEIVGQSVLCSALNDYCGKNYSFVFGEEKEALLKSREVKKMKCWPSKESVKVKDGIIIVKLGE